MKVVAINGSPKAKGNTYYALRTVTDELEKRGVEVEIIHIGGWEIHDCCACRKCAITRDGKCSLPDDGVNGVLSKMTAADGLLYGSPVHFSGISGNMKAFMDRAIYASSSNGQLRHKVAAAVVADRRTGGVSAYDQLMHYILYTESIVPASNYWPVVFGDKPGEIEQDIEGMQSLRILGRNMAWLLELIEYGKKKLPAPEPEQKIRMSFIR